MKDLPLRFICPLSLCIAIGAGSVTAQDPISHTSSELRLRLQKMLVLGSVLHVGAHPDDENNALIVHLSKNRLMRTGYLSATRGDGGQNDIGDEKGAPLGLLRTQELLAGRRLDGAEQYFSRALDFGYSLSPEEAFRFWNKDSILADFVWVIRKFRPDVMIARFPTTGEGGHGHHTASAILAGEAFAAAGDPSRFPEQLRHVQPWQPKRLVWNAWPQIVDARGGETAALLREDIGAFNPLLGKSTGELAGEIRSLHKCQGMGTPRRRGENIAHFEHLDGTPAKTDLFDDIETSWARVEGGTRVQGLLETALRLFDDSDPAAIVPYLIAAESALEPVAAEPWARFKREELLDLIRDCAGIWLEATADRHAATAGEPVRIRMEMVNRSRSRMQLRSLKLAGRGATVRVDTAIAPQRQFSTVMTGATSAGTAISNPYWLHHASLPGRFVVTDPLLIGTAENAPVHTVVATIATDAGEVSIPEPVRYRWRDPLDGDRYRPFQIAPPVTANFASGVYVFADSNPRTVRVEVHAGRDGVSGTVALRLGELWQVAPPEAAYELEKAGDVVQLAFTVTPPASQDIAAGTLAGPGSGKGPFRSLRTIAYDHIPHQSYFPTAEARFVRINIERASESIGYVMGPGDEVPQNLEQVGYDVQLLTDEQLANADLSEFDAIVVGVLAYNTRASLSRVHDRLLEYAENGGTLVVQYQRHFRLKVPQIGPFPITLSRERVTQEDAAVRMLNPQHPVLQTPNEITAADFDGWVQERGLYFATSFDPRYQPLLESADTGRPAYRGGLLYADYGKGRFIYAAWSFFRQLPAGVPGAYRLFANLISTR